MSKKVKAAAKKVSKGSIVTGSIDTGYTWKCGCKSKAIRKGSTDHKMVFRCAVHAKRRVSIVSPNPYPINEQPVPATEPKADPNLTEIRAEISERTAILRVERKNIKHTTPKLTQAEREHLHSFAFTSEQVRREIEGN